MEKFTVYQVLPRLFGNDNETRKPNGTILENGVGKFSAFDAKALKNIRELGITHIWYTGILEHATQTDYSAIGIEKDHPAVVKGRAGSPYAVKDYYDVCPDLADDAGNRMQEFEELVKRTQKAGLKVIIDFVPNHVARRYCSDAKPAGIADLGENDNPNLHFSLQNNFYYLNAPFTLPVGTNNDSPRLRFTENPAKATGNDCFSPHPSRNDWYETVKLNYGVDYLGGGARHFNPMPDTWHKMRDILLFWAGKGVDAFRCDMAEMVPVEFWAWAVAEVKKQFPGIVFIAEVYNPNEYRNYLFTGGFDYLYDKVGLYDTLRNVVCGYQPASDITRCWQSLEGIGHRMLNFLENHDEQRIASDFFAGDAGKALPALLVSALMNDAPFMLYSGQELGERGMDAEGFSGLDGRTTIFDYWKLKTSSPNPLSTGERALKAFYRKVLKLCLQEDGIRNGGFYDLMYLNFNNPHFDTAGQYAFLRHTGKEILLVAANFDSEDKNVEINLGEEVFDYLKVKSAKTTAVDLLTGKTFELDFCPVKPVRLLLKACNGAVLKIQYSICAG
ncbi:MAG: alpha-amylase [Prevotellaceae bacterium]|jgi:glycosidase|nr:alpha-amylase [Prevotellaceae bacterium]